jgi:YaiO family outer membrane protein
MMMLLALSLVATIADGDVAMTKGDYTAAAQSYRAEVTAHPDSYEAGFKLARALSFSGHRNEAIRLYTELLSTRPKNTDLLLARGRTYAWENRWNEAEADLTAVTTQSPDYGDAWSALGDMYLWSERPDDAARAFGKWIAADPNDPRAYIARARAYRSAGDLDAAGMDFESARAHGAPDSEIDRYLLSLQQRRSEPESAAPETYAWLASLSYGYGNYTPVSSEWHDYSATLRHYWQQGSLGFDYLVAKRFGLSDYAVALDAYVDLWPRSYANIRYQYSPNAKLFSDDAYRMEIFQGVGKGWELSGSYDHMDFGDSNVDMYGAGLGKYTGDWYFRWRTLFVPSSAELSVSHHVLARYYFSGNGDDYFEINTGFGQGGEYVSGTDVVKTTRSKSIGAAVQKYITSRWSLKLSAGYSDDNIYPFYERSISATISTRW